MVITRQLLQWRNATDSLPLLRPTYGAIFPMPTRCFPPQGYYNLGRGRCAIATTVSVSRIWESRQVSRMTRRCLMAKAIPEGYHSVTPMFIFKDARKAIEYYKRAFSAQEHYAMPGPDGKG